MLSAYSEAHDEGELVKSQEPMAKRACALLRLLAAKGIGSLIREACGLGNVDVDAVRAEVERQLAATFAPRLDALDREAVRKADLAAVTAQVDERIAEVRREHSHIEALHACPGHVKVIGERGGNQIRQKLREIADLSVEPLTNLEDRRFLVSSRRSRKETELRKHVEHAAKSWDNLFDDRLQPAMAWLDTELKHAHEVASARAAAGQQDLFRSLFRGKSPPPPGQ